MRVGNRTQLSDGIIYNDLERPKADLRLRHSLTLNVFETVRDIAIVTMEY